MIVTILNYGMCLHRYAYSIWNLFSFLQICMIKGIHNNVQKSRVVLHIFIIKIVKIK